MLFDKYLDKIFTICFTLKIKIKKQFHEIISENRLEDRGDIRKLHTGEKY